MPGAKVVNASEQKHTGFNRLMCTGQGACSPGKTAEPLAKGGVEAFDVSCVNLATGLSRMKQASNHVFKKQSLPVQN